MVYQFPQCQLECFRCDDELLLMPAGSLNVNSCEQLKLKMLELLKEPCRRLYLYLGRLDVIDSSGLGVLVGIHVTSRNRKIEFKILSPVADQMLLFQATKLNAIFTILSGLEAEDIRARLQQPEYAIDM